jgi:hypothetical protein
MPGRAPTFGRFLSAAALVVCGLGLPASAQAARGEHEVHGAAGVGRGEADVYGASARWLYNATDFWAFGVALQDRRWVGGGGGETAALGEARLVVDALTWVPALGFGVGPAWRSDASTGERWAAVGRVDAQLGWRPVRSWAAWLRLGAERALWGGAQTRWVLSLGASWIHSPFDNLDF